MRRLTTASAWAFPGELPLGSSSDTSTEALPSTAYAVSFSWCRVAVEPALWSSSEPRYTLPGHRGGSRGTQNRWD